MSKRANAIHDSLDLGFSDYFAQMNVREITIRKNGKIVNYAVGLKELDEAIHFSLFNALGSKHPSVQIYVLDFPSDLRASLYMLLGGYYREAFLCLRSWLEMRLLGVFFGLVETDPAKFRMWKRGKFEAPIGRRLVKRVFARAEFQKADGEYRLRKRLSALYADLSKFTHGAGLTKYNLQKMTDNVPRHNPDSVLLFDRLIRRAFVEIVFSLYVAYGEAVVSSLTTREVRNLLLGYRGVTGRYWGGHTGRSNILLGPEWSTTWPSRGRGQHCEVGSSSRPRPFHVGNCPTARHQCRYSPQSASGLTTPPAERSAARMNQTYPEMARNCPYPALGRRVLCLNPTHQ